MVFLIPDLILLNINNDFNTWCFYLVSHSKKAGVRERGGTLPGTGFLQRAGDCSAEAERGGESRWAAGITLH